MKKLTLGVMTAFLLLSSMPTALTARTATEPMSIPANTPAVPAESTTLTARLDEINAMDKSNLSRVERKQLRKEVRSIKSALAINNGGVYLSVGAIVIIVLLLILLL